MHIIKQSFYKRIVKKKIVLHKKLVEFSLKIKQLSTTIYKALLRNLNIWLNQLLAEKKLAKKLSNYLLIKSIY